MGHLCPREMLGSGGTQKKHELIISLVRQRSELKSIPRSSTNLCLGSRETQSRAGPQVGVPARRAWRGKHVTTRPSQVTPVCFSTVYRGRYLLNIISL